MLSLRTTLDNGGRKWTADRQRTIHPTTTSQRHRRAKRVMAASTPLSCGTDARHEHAGTTGGDLSRHRVPLYHGTNREGPVGRAHGAAPAEGLKRPS